MSEKKNGTIDNGVPGYEERMLRHIHLLAVQMAGIACLREVIKRNGE